MRLRIRVPSLQCTDITSLRILTSNGRMLVQLLPHSFIVTYAHRVHLRRRQPAMQAISSTSSIRVEASARRAVTAHVPRASSGRAHARVSQTDSRVTHAPILAARICFIAAGHVRAIKTITSAMGAHTTVRRVSTEVVAAAQVQARVRPAQMRLHMPRSRPRAPSIRTTVRGSAHRISITTRASA